MNKISGFSQKYQTNQINFRTTQKYILNYNILMKKTTTTTILSTIFIILTSVLTTGCMKNTNEFYLGKQYKTDIEKIINNEYPKSIREIYEIPKDFEKETNPYEKAIY